MPSGGWSSALSIDGGRRSRSFGGCRMTCFLPGRRPAAAAQLACDAVQAGGGTRWGLNVLRGARGQQAGGGGGGARLSGVRALLWAAAERLPRAPPNKRRVRRHTAQAAAAGAAAARRGRGHGLCPTALAAAPRRERNLGLAVRRHAERTAELCALRRPVGRRGEMQPNAM